MQNKQRVRGFLLAAVPVLLIAFGVTSGWTQTRGGTITIAQSAAPPNLDCHFDQLEAARNVYLNWCEGLATLDENGTPIPQLAEKWEVSPDGKAITFTLRQGIKFHNGKTMTSDDVRASFERYRRVSPSKSRLDLVEKIETPGPNVVILRLARPSPWMISFLASPLMPIAVYPSELTSAEGGKIENIGTGPYMLAEFNPTRFVTLRRFPDYRPDDRFPGATGFGGRRIAYFDTAKIVFIRESSAQVAALESGQIDLATGIAKPVVERLASNAAIKTYTVKDWGMTWIYVNNGWGITQKLAIRQAVAAAVDADEIMAISTDGSYTLNHSWLYPANKYWPGDIGKEMYNQKNLDKARSLLKQAGYGGEEIIIAATAGRPALKTAAVVLSEQLKKAGFNVKLNVYDHAAFHAQRSKPDGWNLAVNAFSIDPYLGVSAFQYYWDGPKNWANVTDAAQLVKMHAAWVGALESPTFDAQMEGVRALTRIVLEDALFIKVGDNNTYLAARSELQGFVPFSMPRVWNVWRK